MIFLVLKNSYQEFDLLVLFIITIFSLLICVLNRIIITNVNILPVIKSLLITFYSLFVLYATNNLLLSLMFIILEHLLKKGEKPE
jgi:hypothetical protein